MMSRLKFRPRAEFRLQENQRVKESASLAETYRELKSLTVEFAHFSSEGFTRNSLIKYTVNPAHAKSVFRLDCLNCECIRGDFDLSEALGQAVAARQATVTGELSCQGWQSKTTIDTIRCHNILRYKLSLEYATPAAMETAPLRAA